MVEYLTDRRKKVILEEYMLSKFRDKDVYNVVDIMIHLVIPNLSPNDALVALVKFTNATSATVRISIFDNCCFRSDQHALAAQFAEYLNEFKSYLRNNKIDNLL